MTNSSYYFNITFSIICTKLYLQKINIFLPKLSTSNPRANRSTYTCSPATHHNEKIINNFRNRQSKFSRDKPCEDSPHGKSPPGKRGWRRRLSSMSPVDRLAPEGLYGLRHGPEGFLTGFRAAVSNAIVEITRTTVTTTATTMKAVPSSHGAPVSAVIASIMATWTAR